MITLKQLDDRVSVSPQLRPGQIPTVSAHGFKAVINHRPDGEEPGQPGHEDLARALTDLGISNVHLPVRGLPDEAVVDASADLLATDPEAKVLFFCRSGFRSAAVWALIRKRQGWDAEDIRARALAAGYDLSQLPL